MASQTTEEILKFVVKASGNESLTPIVRSILDLSGNSAEAEQAVGDLLTQLSDSQKLSATLDQYRKVGASVLELSKQYDAAKVKVAELGKNLSETDEPTKKQQAEFERSRTALARLGVQYDAQLTKLRGYKSELSAAGVSTSSFSAAQAQLKARATEVTAALGGMATAAKNTKDEQSALAARLAEGDEAFRKQAEASKSAREALDRVKASTDAAAKAQQDAASKSTVLGTAWTKLAAIGATLVGYLTFRTAVEGVKNILGLGDATEKLKKRFEGLYGTQAAGEAALSGVRKLAKDLGLVFADTAESAAKLKGFGIDPLNGSLKALVDQNAKLGGSQETLNGLILATGQAWAKQKLQGEEILQLVERGVPVWDLLSKATGKNVLELQKLSEAGKLGRTEIAALLAEIGKSADGAAAANLNSFSGLIVQLKDRWQQFLQSIADAGVLDYAKQQISGLIDEAKRLATDGTLTQWAKSTADGIKSVAGLIAGAVKTTYEYSGAIVTLGKAYATIKVAQLVADLGSLIARKYAAATAATALGAATATASTAMGGLGTAIGRIPTAIKIGIGIVGAEAAYSAINQLVDSYGQLREAQAKLRLERADLGAGEEKLLAQIEQLKTKYAEYADTAIRSSAELRAMSNDQADAYRRQIEGAQRYFRALEVDARRAGDVAGFQSARQKLVEFQAELDRVKSRFAAIAAETTVVQPKINAFAQSLITAFQTAYKEGSNAAQVIREEFGKIDISTVQGLTDAIESIREIGAVSTEAGAALQRDLRDRLIKLSDDDLKAVREAAQAAFSTGSEQAKAFGKAVEGINLERLGVDLKALKTGFSDAGGAAIDAFRGAIDEVDKLGLTAEQQSAAIARAFDSAFSRAGTRPELEALRAQLNAAFSDGKISAAEYEAKLAQLNERLDELANKTAPAANGVRQVASAMREAAEAAADASEAGSQVADSFGNIDRQSSSTSVSLGNMTEEFTRQAMEAAGASGSIRNYIRTWNDWVAQALDEDKAIANRIDQLTRQNAALDEESRLRRELELRYGTSSTRLEELLQLELKRLKAKKDQIGATRVEIEQEKELEAMRSGGINFGGGDQSQSTGRAATGSRGGSSTVEIVLRNETNATGQTARLSTDQLDQVARTVLDALHRDMNAAGR